MRYEDSENEKREYRLFIADGQELLREGVKSLFRDVPWAKIVGEADSAASVFSFAQEQGVDLILLNPSINGDDEAACTSCIKQLSEGTRTVVLSDRESKDWVYACLDAGAQGFFTTDTSGRELLSGVRAVLEGRKYLSPSIISSVAQGFLQGRKSAKPFRLIESLTKREREVFELVGKGNKNREIAELLYISIKTVEKHRANMMRKLELHRPVEVRRLWQDWTATT